MTKSKRSSPIGAVFFHAHLSLEQVSFVLGMKKGHSALRNDLFDLVGMTGFEPATSRPPDERATGLRYIPILLRGRKGRKFKMEKQ